MKTFTLDSLVYQLDETNEIRTYTLISNVTITTLDPVEKIVRVDVEDVSASTGDPTDLFKGTFIGTKANLVGNNGYPGNASIRCGIFIFTQPQYDALGDNSIAYWQKGNLTPVPPNNK
jgi:hypothetical protein